MHARAAIVLSCFLSLASQAARAAEKSKPLIQIGVEVVEVDEQRAKNVGVEWLNALHIQEASVPSLFNVGTLTRDAIFADLQFLEQNGAVDLLANPKLLARDGTSATFHAGGELPYATAASLGTVTVVFKPYGVELKVTPHLNEEGLVELSLEAEVSGPDSQNGVSLSGNVVPGIRSRKATSELTMAPGTTLTMAGLLQNDKEWMREGVPILMHIPLLKYLFSHKVETLRKTSVVIFVTPTLVDVPKATAALSRGNEDDDLLKIEEEKDGIPTRG